MIRKLTFFITALLLLINPTKAEDWLTHINRIRTATGLSSVKANPYLAVAAAQHAMYCSRNGLITHIEDPGKDGFYGATPGDRIAATGYRATWYGETIGVAKNSLKAVDLFMQSLYHRLILLSFYADEVGHGKAMYRDANYVLVYDLATQRDPNEVARNNPRVVRWPAPGYEKNYPVLFGEIPNPLPDYRIAGLPITVQFNPEYVGHAEPVEFKILDPQGKEVPAVLLDSSSDVNGKMSELDFALIPTEVLKYGETYRVKAVFNVDGKIEDLSWSFKTYSLPYPFYTIKADIAEIYLKPGKTYLLILVPRNRYDIPSSYRYIYQASCKPYIYQWDLDPTLYIVKIKETCPLGSDITLTTDSGRMVKMLIGEQDSATYPEPENQEELSIDQPQQPPAEQYIGLETDMQNAHVKISSGNRLNANFNYTDPVYILVGIMSCDYKHLYWLNQNSCNLESRLSIPEASNKLNCEDVPLPIESGLVFWIVTSTPPWRLDWERGVYELKFYPFGGCNW